MRTKISVILLFISLALLIIYGADVISSKMASNDGKSGFLQLNEAIRGGGLGGGAVILSIIAFAISMKERSTLVVVLLIAQGMVHDGGSKSSTVYGTTGLGILLVALGIVKVFITRKK